MIGGALAVIFLIVLPLAIYGLNRYLAASKSAEAKTTVGAIQRSAVGAYEREALPSEADPEAPAHRLCASASPVPGQLPSGRKYQSAPDDWEGDPDAGWACLRFQLSQPQYYQYHYNVGGGWVTPDNPALTGDDARTFEAAAMGDLDGDGKPSVFSLVGRVGADGSIISRPQLYMQDELE